MILKTGVAFLLALCLLGCSSAERKASLKIGSLSEPFPGNKNDLHGPRSFTAKDTLHLLLTSVDPIGQPIAVEFMNGDSEAGEVLLTQSLCPGVNDKQVRGQFPVSNLVLEFGYGWYKVRCWAGGRLLAEGWFKLLEDKWF